MKEIGVVEAEIKSLEDRELSLMEALEEGVVLAELSRKAAT